MKSLLCCLCLFVAVGLCAQETGKIFVVRHAEKQSDADDALLSAKGHARAECLAQTLKDAHIKSAFVTQYTRTRQTAAPTVQESHATEKSIEAKKYSDIVSAAKDAANSGNVLIVGHSNTLPDLLKAFGTPAVNIPDNIYDQLFIFDTKDPKDLTIVHYCPMLPAEATKHAPNSMAK